jgi:hypothetical protein
MVWGMRRKMYENAFSVNTFAMQKALENLES